jgi:hypothetical protein
VDGFARDRVEVGGCIAEPLGERAPHLEVELAVRIEGHVAIHRLHFLLERNGVDALRGSGCRSHCGDLLGG